MCINPSFHTFRTPVPIVVYQPCPLPLSVPRNPLLCTNRVPPSRSVPQKPLPCTNRAPHPVPYRRSPSRVPTVPLIPFRTAGSPPVYQPCPPSLSVPQTPLSCTNRVLHPVPYRRSPSRVPTVPLTPFPYLRSPSRVPTVPLTPFRTAEAPPVYQPCPPSRSVPRNPLPCTNLAPHPVLYLS